MKKIIVVVCLVLLAGTVLVGAQEKHLYNNGEIDFVPLNVKVKLAADDMGSSLQTIQYTINNGDIQQYTSPIKLTSEGRYVIAYRAIDKLGNIGKEKIYSCIVDDTPPYFSASATGPAFLEKGIAYGTSHTRILLWADDKASGVAGIYFNIDNQGFMKYTGPGMLKGEGKHTAEAYAVDNVGNRTRTYSFVGYIDNTPPTVKITPKEKLVELQGENFANSSNEFSVSAYDNIAGVKEILVSVDGSGYLAYLEPFAIQSKGAHTIKAKAVDYLDNESQPVELSFYVDVDTPVTTIEVTP